MTELKNRGVQDALICLVDGLKGFPEAIEAVFPQAQIQTCIVHLMRHSLEYCSWQESQARSGRAQINLPGGERRGRRPGAVAFEVGRWGQRYPPIVASWRRNWERVIPFFAYPQDVRRVLYTTNAIESLNNAATQDHEEPWTLSQLMKRRQNCCILRFRNVTAKWKNAGREWKPARRNSRSYLPIALPPWGCEILFSTDLTHRISDTLEF